MNSNNQTDNQQSFRKRRYQTPINNRIYSEEVRLITSDGTQVGVKKTREALAMAIEEGLDLVVINENQTPPVAKIVDYGKYKFQQSKQKKENKKKSKSQNVSKDVKMSPRIDAHDFLVKLNKIREGITKGYKVRALIEMKGRENRHPELAENLLKKILESIKDIAKSDRQPDIKKEGRFFTLMLAPIGVPS